MPTLGESLIRVLRARPHVPAAQLRTALGVSRATLMRAVHAASPEVLTIGRARRTYYAARRRLRGSAEPLPVFQVDEHGGSEQVGSLNLAYPDGTAYEFSAPSLWPLDESMRDGWFDGLPYFLQDMRPAGFLGRRFARAHARVLQVGDDPRQWSDDDVLYAISLFGADQSGNFVVGEGAFRLWQDQIQHAPACWRSSSAPGLHRAGADCHAGRRGRLLGCRRIPQVHRVTHAESRTDSCAREIFRL